MGHENRIGKLERKVAKLEAAAKPLTDEQIANFPRQECESSPTCLEEHPNSDYWCYACQHNALRAEVKRLRKERVDLAKRLEIEFGADANA